MARLWYGGTSADFAIAQGAEADIYALDSLPPSSPVVTEFTGHAVMLPLVAIVFDVYTDAGLTSVTTDLLNEASSPITQVSSETDFDVRGTIPRFQGPNNHEGPLWLSVDAVTGFRVEPESGPLYTRVTAIETDLTTAATDITDAETDLGALDTRTDVREAIPGPDVQIFNTAGSGFTWTKPAGARKVFVECQGGGSAGGGCAATAAGQGAEGGGGGGGGYAAHWFNAADLPATVSVTVGAGGAGQVNGQGLGGGNSLFVGYIKGTGSATGGDTMAATSGNSDEDGGAGFTGAEDTGGPTPHILARGGDGGNAIVIGGVPLRQNHGGSSGFSGGNTMVATSGTSGTGDAGVRGAGGAGSRNGASQSARAGGAGGPGFVRVTTYF